jgi:hypothetical protein
MSPSAVLSKAALMASRMSGQASSDGGLTGEIVGSAELGQFSDLDAFAHDFSSA